MEGDSSYVAIQTGILKWKSLREAGIIWIRGILSDAHTICYKVITWTFAEAGQQLWNSLPPERRQPDLSLGQVRRIVKSHLFC